MFLYYPTLQLLFMKHLSLFDITVLVLWPLHGFEIWFCGGFFFSEKAPIKPQ